MLGSSGAIKPCGCLGGVAVEYVEQAGGATLFVVSRGSPAETPEGGRWEMGDGSGSRRSEKASWGFDGT